MLNHAGSLPGKYRKLGSPINSGRDYAFFFQPFNNVIVFVVFVTTPMRQPVDMDTRGAVLPRNGTV